MAIKKFSNFYVKHYMNEKSNHYKNILLIKEVES